MPSSAARCPTTDFTMSSKIIKKVVFSLTIFLFWIGVWYLAALLVDSRLLLPTPLDTLKALFELLCSAEIYKAIAFTLLRVILGLGLGIVLGIALAIISYRSPFVSAFLKPLISVIRATPVASFIVLLWVLIKGDALSVVIAILMVMPIVWQNTVDGFNSVPKDLIEVLDIFPVSQKRRFEALYLPILNSYIYPAIITSVGLAWKSEIAAEIIAYTKNSIGMHINDAKTFVLSPTVFALTFIVIVLSLSLEALTKKLLKGVKK